MPPNPPSNDPSSNDPSQARPAEPELDDLISEVTGLADEIAVEVGASAADVDAAIDARISRMEEKREAEAADAAMSTVEPVSRAVSPPSPSGKAIQLGKRKTDPKPDGDEPRPGPDPHRVKSKPAAVPHAVEPKPEVAAKPFVEDGPSLAGKKSSRTPPDRSAFFAVLDGFDALFEWCGPGIRHVLGWVALAVLFAAVLIFILSFFQ